MLLPGEDYTAVTQVPGEAVACVTAGKIGSICRPENVFAAPERFAARPDASLMLAPLGSKAIRGSAEGVRGELPIPQM